MSLDVIQQLEKAGPYRVTEERLLALSGQLPADTVRTITLSDQNDLFPSIALALGFPAHFGSNFDALYDCLCDPEVVPEQQLVLVLRQPEVCDEPTLDTLIAVLQAVADEWRDGNRFFWALFVSARLDLEILPG